MAHDVDVLSTGLATDFASVADITARAFAPGSLLLPLQANDGLLDGR